MNFFPCRLWNQNVSDNLHKSQKPHPDIASFVIHVNIIFPYLDKIKNVENFNFSFSPNIMRMIKVKTVRWVRPLACMGKMR
jgi:hypothetical protein